jgi:hypothetical protein
MIKRIERSTFESLTSKRLLPISRLIGYAIHVVARMGHRRVASDAGGCFKAAGRSQRTSFRKEGEEPGPALSAMEPLISDSLLGLASQRLYYCTVSPELQLRFVPLA